MHCLGEFVQRTSQRKWAVGNNGTYPECSAGLGYVWVMLPVEKARWVRARRWTRVRSVWGTKGSSVRHELRGLGEARGTEHLAPGVQGCDEPHRAVRIKGFRTWEVSSPDPPSEKRMSQGLVWRWAGPGSCSALGETEQALVLRWDAESAEAAGNLQEGPLLGSRRVKNGAGLGPLHAVWEKQVRPLGMFSSVRRREWSHARHRNPSFDTKVEVPFRTTEWALPRHLGWVPEPTGGPREEDEARSPDVHSGRWFWVYIAISVVFTYYKGSSAGAYPGFKPQGVMKSFTTALGTWPCTSLFHNDLPQGGFRYLFSLAPGDIDVFISICVPSLPVHRAEARLGMTRDELLWALPSPLQIQPLWPWLLRQVRDGQTEPHVLSKNFSPSPLRGNTVCSLGIPLWKEREGTPSSGRRGVPMLDTGLGAWLQAGVQASPDTGPTHPLCSWTSSPGSWKPVSWPWALPIWRMVRV